MNVSRMRYLCGILHRTGLAGPRQPERTVDLRRSRRGSPYEHEGRSHTLRTENWAAAVVDRLTFNAHIINTGTASYRLRTTKEQRP